jgi:hypothetical protein
MKQGDVVLYTVNGVQRNALVLMSRDAEADHLGSAGEPTLHLAFLAPEREAGQKGKAGYIPQVYIEFDVVHASHEFSDDFKLKQGLQTPAQVTAVRGSGEWTEVNPLPSAEDLDAVVEEVKVKEATAKPKKGFPKL